jgi:LemA protein
MGKGLKITLIVAGVLLVMVLVLFSWFRSGYDNVIAMDENVKGKWAQVENQLKRRYDLIPNLVETVKGYARHEKEIFENIAEARTKYFQAKGVKGKVQAANQLEGVLSRLLLLREAYPQLKANENFMKLQDSLGTFFGRFFAAIAGVSSAEYYELPEGEAATPKVKF